MNKTTAFLLIVITALSFVLGTTMPSKAQNKNFTGIQVFITGNNRVGFLDQSNGRIYLYDSDISKCIFVGQIQSLGDPINVITSNPGNSLNQ